MPVSGEKPFHMIVPDEVFTPILLTPHASAKDLYHFLHGLICPVFRVCLYPRFEDHAGRLKRYLAKDVKFALLARGGRSRYPRRSSLM